MTSNEFFQKHAPGEFTRQTVIELMEQWQEYNFAGRLLYSYDSKLNQDELGIETQDDFDNYIEFLINE